MDERQNEIQKMRIRIWIVVSCFLALMLLGSNIGWSLYSQELKNNLMIYESSEAHSDSDDHYTDTDSTIVYTLNYKSRTKYHRFGCGSISNKCSIPMTKGKAEDYGKQPCRRCNP